MRERGWRQADVILVTGDAYVDHPSFGVALIGRWLEKQGYRVAVLAQPDWREVEAFRIFGPPRLFWGVTSGAVDSRLNRYMSLGHIRQEDMYSPGGKTGLRPEKPLLAYCARIRQAYKGVPVILGGLEASLRRLVHYDFIEDQLKRSVLLDAKADLLVYGMAERSIGEVARRLAGGETVRELVDVAGTVFVASGGREVPEGAVRLASLAEQQEASGKVLEAQLLYERHGRPGGSVVFQESDAGVIVVRPPGEVLTTEEMDELYDLPFARRWHSRYDKEGGVGALEPVKFSITTHRGCFGGCNFCALYYHQGKQISSRSEESIMAEAEVCRRQDDFRGTISDIGGPTANMYGMRCGREDSCNRASCLFPSMCEHLQSTGKEMIMLMEAVQRWRRGQVRQVRVYIASGVRHDLALGSPDYIRMLAADFVGGHLKVAPEHFCGRVLEMMGKPSFELFEEFEARFAEASRRAGKEQYLVPYFMSSHPGCTAEDGLALTEYLVGRNWRVRQVQDFTPIPMTMSTAMYLAERDKRGRRIHVARGRSEKRLQMGLLKYHERRNEKVISKYLQSQHKNKLLSQIRGLQVDGRGGNKGRRGGSGADDCFE